VSNELEQFRISYEDLGMTPAEIAEDRSLDIAAVKAGLMSCSAKYRRDCGKEEPTEDGLNFTDDDLRRVNDVIKEIALGSDDDNLRLKAAIYIRDDKKGRKEINKAVGSMQFNILQFNEAMQQARAVSNNIKQSMLGDTIHV
jgi:hypothetical protein